MPFLGSVNCTISSRGSAGEWQACLDHALPRRWIAQRFFKARQNAAGEVVNHGVYLVAGRAAGMYARLSSGATDVSARSAAVEVTG